MSGNLLKRRHKIVSLLHRCMHFIIIHKFYVRLNIIVISDIQCRINKFFKYYYKPGARGSGQQLFYLNNDLFTNLFVSSIYHLQKNVY